MIVPLKLGKNVLGCIEVANKRGIQEFTDQDLESLRIISDNVSGGIISYEMRQQTLKREIDEDIKYQKGLLNESYNQFLAPILTDIQIMVNKTLKAEKILLFLHNKDIDHLYSFSIAQTAQTFAPESIRMKSNLGLAGKAFTSCKI